MNALTSGSHSYPFATADELLALPRVREFTADPTVSHLLYNAEELWAAKGNPTVLCLVGRLKERVALPAQVCKPRPNPNEEKGMPVTETDALL